MPPIFLFKCALTEKHPALQGGTPSLKRVLFQSQETPTPPLLVSPKSRLRKPDWEA